MEHSKRWPVNFPAGLSKAALVAIAIYRKVISPLIWSAVGNVCRFDPSCSAYAQQSFEQHSFLFATWLTTKRICKCHPLGPFGYDPVPERKSV